MQRQKAKAQSKLMKSWIFLWFDFFSNVYFGLSCKFVHYTQNLQYFAQFHFFHMKFKITSILQLFFYKNDRYKNQFWNLKKFSTKFHCHKKLMSYNNFFNCINNLLPYCKITKIAYFKISIKNFYFYRHAHGYHDWF